jgi:hypothetical protein
VSRPLPPALVADLKRLRAAPIPKALQGKIEALRLGVFFRANDGIRFEELCDAYPPIGRLAAWARTENEAREVRTRAYQSVPYQEIYLWTDHWHWTAEEAKYYAGGRCEAAWEGQQCRHKGTEVHHLPWAVVGREQSSDLLVVCRTCHTRLHKGE